MRLRLTSSLALLLLAAAPAAAHPLPNFRYDRELKVRINPQGVEVRYVLQLSFWTIFADNRKLFTPEEIEQMGGKLREVTRRYCEKMAPLLAEKLDGNLDGKKLPFRVAKLEVLYDRDHARFQYVFEAPWRVNGGGPENTFALEDHNFENDNGAVWVTIDDYRSGLDVQYTLEPTDLQQKDPSQYKPGDAERARKASAVFTAPDLPPRPPEGPGAAPAPTAAPAAPSETQVTVIEEARDEGFVNGVLARGPKALFDTNYGSGVLLLLATAFGAFHAFAPGHGKSVAAAFLVGEQGTFRQAALLGLSTTFAHTGSVILIAGFFYLRYRESVPQDAQHWLGLVGGLLVLFVGMWLFMRRLRGQVDHVHLFGGCSDMCGNHSARPQTPECRVPLRGEPGVSVEALQLVPRKTPLSWLRVVLLGIGAGAIPCVDAVLLLMLAVSAGKLAFALPLLVAFSIGLSSVLMLIGMLVILLHRAGRRGFSERGWFRFLPTASAVLLMGMGMWMARDAWKGFTTGITH